MYRNKGQEYKCTGIEDMKTTRHTSNTGLRRIDKTPRNITALSHLGVSGGITVLYIIPP